MKSIIINKCKILNNNYISVHIRRTDHIFIAKKNNCYTDDVDFFTFIDKETETKRDTEKETNSKTTNLYIATDNKDTFNIFKNKYKDLIKIEYHNTNEYAHRHTTLQDAIIDLYMCVYSKKFKGSGWSSFTDTIFQLRDLHKKN